MEGAALRASFSVSPSLSVAPLPILANWLSDPDGYEVLFDRPLRAGERDGGYWRAWKGGVLQQSDLAWADGRVASVWTTAGRPGPYEKRVEYDGSGGDLTGEDGTPVASFDIVPT